MFDRIHCSSIGVEYVVLQASAYRSMSADDRARFELLAPTEARHVVTRIGFNDASALHRMHSLVTRDVGFASHGNYRTAGPLTGVDPRLERVLDALGASVGATSAFASVVVLRGRGAGTKAQQAGHREYLSDQRLGKALRQLGTGDVVHRGDSYAIVNAEHADKLSRRDSYETLGQRESLQVLKEMAEEPLRTEQQRKPLQELLELATRAQEAHKASGVLLLRRERFYARPEREDGPVTPSQLRATQSHWIEIEAVDKDKLPVSSVKLELVLASGGTTVLETNKLGVARLEKMQAGTITIRVLDLDGSSWRPVGGASAAVSSKQLGSRTHIVRPGECISKVAHRYGIKDWKTLWNDPKNSGLKKRRKNPHVLRPGDKIIVATKLYEIARATDAKHKIEVSRGEKRVRVHLRGLGARPFKDLEYDYSYKIGEAVIEKPGSGPTDANGKLEETIPITVRTIEVRLRKSKIRFSFDVSSLEPARDDDTQEVVVPGAQRRLHALGYVGDGEAGSNEGADGALALFQRLALNRSAPTGTPDQETLSALENAHTA